MKARTLLAALTVVALAACGGSGGHPGAPTGNGGGTGPVADTSLQTTVPAAVYADAARAQIYAELQVLRSAAGVGLLAQSTKLDQAAQAHAAYLGDRNIVGHYETAGDAGFTGVGPGDRLTAVGYDWVGYGEVAAQGSADQSIAGCIAGWANTVYHLGDLYNTNREVGVGVAAVTRGGATQPDIVSCVMDFGTKAGNVSQLPSNGNVATYPTSGATGIKTAFSLDSESPRPLPTVSGQVGQPILASTLQAVAGGAALTVNEFTLTDAAGQQVPAYVLAHSSTVRGAQVTLTTDDNVQPGQVFLVPLAPLTPATRYTVKYGSSGGSAIWSFTTN